MITKHTEIQEMAFRVDIYDDMPDGTCKYVISSPGNEEKTDLHWEAGGFLTEADALEAASEIVAENGGTPLINPI